MVIALGAILVIGALLRGDDGDGSPDEREPTTEADSEATDDETSTTDRTSDPDLERALLTVDDLPDGWAQDDATGQLAELCEGRDPVGEIAPTGLSQAGFTRGDEGLVLSNVVADYDSAARAGELLEAVREAIGECGQFDTESGSYTITETDAPDVGDDAVAARLIGTTTFGDLQGEILYVRVGDRVTAVAMAGLSGVDADVVADAAEVVADRL